MIEIDEIIMDKPADCTFVHFLFSAYYHGGNHHSVCTFRFHTDCHRACAASVAGVFGMCEVSVPCSGTTSLRFTVRRSRATNPKAMS